MTVLAIVHWLTIIATALIAGTFFAFSTFVMSALGRLPPSQGIAAMQSINIVVVNPLFMAAFLGGAILSLVLLAMAIGNMDAPQSRWLIAGAVLYLVGSIGVTFVFNIPLNNALAVADPSKPESAVLWADYVQRWTLWNSVRGLASLLAMLALVIGREV